MRTRLLPALLLLAACGGSPTRLPHAAPTPGLALDTIARGLNVPWDVAFAPDGRVFVTERTGRVRVVENGALRPEPWATLQVERRSELGLMGIALAPDFARSGHVYVVGSFPGDPHVENRVYRFTDRGGRGTEPRLVLGGMRVARYHAGAALRFGPDGMLYLTTGDATRPGEAQDTASLLGKVLRMRPDGSPPADNPRPGSRVYARGVRNPQGLAWHPDGGQLFAPDHGPTWLPREFFRSGRDELNAIVPGGNHGWPAAAGNQGGPGFVRPLVEWTPAVGPGALAIYDGTALPWRGDALMAALRGKALLRIVLRRDAGRWRAVGQEALFKGQLGRIRAVAVAPDGSVYLTTSNRDGRGDRRPYDDLLLRIRPR